jgi:hypothetical protein
MVDVGRGEPGPAQCLLDRLAADLEGAAPELGLQLGRRLVGNAAGERVGRRQIKVAFADVGRVEQLADRPMAEAEQSADLVLRIGIGWKCAADGSDRGRGFRFIRSTNFCVTNHVFPPFTGPPAG